MNAAAMTGPRTARDSIEKRYDDASITAHVGIGQIPGGFGIAVELKIAVPCQSWKHDFSSWVDVCS